MNAFSGTVDITPELGTALSGWAGRRRSANGVADPLQVNFLGFETPGQMILIMSLDTLFGSAELEKYIETALADASTADRVDVISVASHTHFAPALDRDKPLLGEPDLSWQEEVASRVVAAILSARKQGWDIESAQWSIASGEIPLAVSRRLAWPWPVLSKRSLLRFPGIVMAPNAKAEIDKSARLAMISDGQTVRALIVNWAAHPTVYPERDNISADYIGVIRNRLRAAFGQPDLPVIFLQGFAGDIRPLINGTGRQPWWRRLMSGPTFSPITISDWREWANKVAQYFAGLSEAALQKRPLPLANMPSLSEAQMPLSQMLDGDHKGRLLHMRHLQLADGLAFLFVNAEPSSAFVKAVKEHAPSAWPVGYAGDVFGYWPTSQQCREGGYEAVGFLPLFGLSGRFRSNNSEMFDGLIKETIGRNDSVKS